MTGENSKFEFKMLFFTSFNLLNYRIILVNMSFTGHWRILPFIVFHILQRNTFLA